MFFVAFLVILGHFWPYCLVPSGDLVFFLGFWKANPSFGVEPPTSHRYYFEARPYFCGFSFSAKS